MPAGHSRQVQNGTMLLTAFEVKFSDAISSRPWTCSTPLQQSIVRHSDGKLLPAMLSHNLIVCGSQADSL